MTWDIRPTRSSVSSRRVRIDRAVGMSEHHTMTTVNRWGQIAAVGVTFVGLLLPWAHLLDLLSRRGIASSDGLIVLTVAAVAGLVAIFRWTTRRVAIVVTVLGLVALLVCIGAMFSIAEQGLRLGVGAPVSAIGTAGIATFGVRHWLAARAGRDTDSDRRRADTGLTAG